MKHLFRNKKSLKFTTQEKDSAKKRHIFLLSFIIFVVVFGSFSVLFLLHEYNYDLSALMGTGETTTKKSEEDTTQADIKLSGGATFLCAGTANSKDDVYFISIVHADMSDVRFSVCSISPDTVVRVSDEDKSLKAYFKEGGMKALEAAVEKYSSVEIDRYIGVNEKKFKSLVKLLGNLELNLKENISYEGDDFSLHLTQGGQSVGGDNLMKYIRYRGMTYSASALLAQSEIIGDMIDQMLSEKNVEKGDDLFNQLINLVDSDISVIDYAGHKNYLAAIVRSSDRKESQAVSLSDLKYICDK